MSLKVDYIIKRSCNNIFNKTIFDKILIKIDYAIRRLVDWQILIVKALFVKPEGTFGTLNVDYNRNDNLYYQE